MTLKTKLFINVVAPWFYTAFTSHLIIFTIFYDQQKNYYLKANYMDFI